jgi:tetraacyldisaccharide 4'-kinase
LDDAFQHRRVIPSLSILLTDSNRLFYEDCLLPAGRLREPSGNKSRADIILCTKCPAFFQQIDYQVIAKNIGLNSNQQLYFTSYRYKSLLPVFPGNNLIKKESIERLKQKSYSFLLLAGIANPKDLIRYLENYTSGLHVLIYPDHHSFSRKDILVVIKTFNEIKNENKILITSEKDAARLINNPYISEEIKAFIYYLPVEVVFNLNEEEMFIQKIENHVTNFKRNRILA